MVVTLLVTAINALATLVDELFRLLDDEVFVAIEDTTAVKTLATLVEEIFILLDDDCPAASPVTTRDISEATLERERESTTEAVEYTLELLEALERAY